MYVGQEGQTELGHRETIYECVWVGMCVPAGRPLIFLDLAPPSKRNKRVKAESASISASSVSLSNPLCDTHSPRASCMKDERCEVHSPCKEV